MALVVPAPASLTRLTLGSGVVYDPNSRLASALTEDSAGITAVLNGSWSDAYPGGWPHVIWPLAPTRIPMPAFDATAVWNGIVQVFERSAPSLTSDTAVCFGLINESTMTTQFVDGVFVGLRWASSTRNVRAGYIANATTTLTDDSGTSGNTRSLFGVFPRFGDATSGTCCNWTAFGFDASGTIITGDNMFYSSVLTLAFTHAFLAFGRTAATAGSATVKVDTFFSADPGVLRAS